MTVPLAIAIVVAANLVVLAGLFAMRRLAPPEGFWGQPEPNHSGSALTVSGSAFALITAFVLFLSLQGFSSAEKSASAEAQATEHLFHDAERFHPALRATLHAAITCYARAVVDEEWPRMSDDEHSSEVEELALRFELAGARADYADPREVQAVGEFADADADRAEAREDRLELGGSSTPTLLWITLLSGWVLVAAYICSFAKPAIRWWLQVIPVVAFTTIGTLNLCVIAFLDRPFADVPGAVAPTAMRETLHVIDAELTSEYPGTPIPCR